MLGYEDLLIISWIVPLSTVRCAANSDSQFSAVLLVFLIKWSSHSYFAFSVIQPVYDWCCDDVYETLMDKSNRLIAEHRLTVPMSVFPIVCSIKLNCDRNWQTLHHRGSKSIICKWQQCSIIENASTNNNRKTNVKVNIKAQQNMLISEKTVPSVVHREHRRTIPGHTWAKKKMRPLIWLCDDDAEQTNKDVHFILPLFVVFSLLPCQPYLPSTPSKPQQRTTFRVFIETIF